MSDVRVGIVSWNTAPLLDDCLRALPAALDGLDAEVVVVDNASADDSAEVAERHTGVTVIRNGENAGYARGMNAALGGTAAPALIALNPDTVPRPGSLRRLVGALEGDTRLGLVVPRLLNADGTPQHSVYRFPSLRVAAAVSLLPSRMHRGRIGRRFWLEGASPHDESCDIDWAIGAVHCIRRVAVPGPVYDEQSFMYAEDLELGWRLARAGWRRRFVADAEVVHVGNAAGEQAWGETRTARWLDPTYDWYADAHGDASARAWAAINVAGVGVKLVTNRLLVQVRGARSGDAGSRVRQFRELLPLHARKLIHGPRAPLTDGQGPA